MEGVIKRFGETPALDGLDLTVAAGGIFGLLGRNGAGKTTTVRILATLARPDRGLARVLGHDVERERQALRRRISLTGQFAAVDDDLTGTENLTLLARLYGLSRRDARARAAGLLAGFDLSEASDRQVKTYSGGMRRRVDLAASIIVRPDLLFLDEPTTGLDPHSRTRVWEVVRGVVDQGTTVLLTTQYLEEADRLCDRIAVIDAGRLVAQGSPSRLKASIGSGSLELRLADPLRRADAARSVGPTVRPGADGATLSVPVSQSAQAARLLLELEREGIEVAAFAMDQPRLDDVFLALTGRTAEDDLDAEEAA